MKRLTSILLVLTLVLSCFAFVGCAWADFFKPNTVRQTTEALIEAPFEHGENLNNDDIRFIMDYLDGFTAFPGYPKGDNPTFSEILSRMNATKDHGRTYYKMKVDLESEPHFICAYIDKDFREKNNLPENFPIPFSFEAGTVPEMFVWYKFEDRNSIPEQIGNGDFVGAFAIFDATLVLDILNDRECDYKCRYFVPLSKGFLNMDIASEYNVNEYYMVCASVDFNSERITYIAPINFEHINYNSPPELIHLYIDEKGNYCHYVTSSSSEYDPDTFSFEKHREAIGDLYDQIIPYLKVIKKDDGYSGYIVCIELSDLGKCYRDVIDNK